MKAIRMKKTKVPVEVYTLGMLPKLPHLLPEGFRKDKHMLVMLHGKVTVVRIDSVEDVK